MKKVNSQPIIQVTNLTKKYKDLVAVDNLNFEVRTGEVFAFLGPNGAGKTTTIKMLTTLLHPTSGNIRVNGFDPISQQNEVRQSFGIVFQDQSLDEELTAGENMEFHGVLYQVPRDKCRVRIEALLRTVDLWERKDSLVKTFSGGMKRRLEIARGLLHHPKILFLDEPTIGLDPQTRNKIWEKIRDLNQKYNTTIFFTTHYLEEAEKMAKYIALIDKGKIAASGTIDELKQQTSANTLEEAYLALTGKDIREEDASTVDRMRSMYQRRRGMR